jgi:hypothetical protein
MMHDEPSGGVEVVRNGGGGKVTPANAGFEPLRERTHLTSSAPAFPGL